MSESRPTQAEPIPEMLSHLIQLNARYQVLLCLSEHCRCAVSPVAIVGHLRRKHRVRLELRKQVERYIRGFPNQYDYTTVELPVDQLAPQPIIQVSEGFQCQQCPYKSRNRSGIRKHCNKDHSMRGGADEDLFQPVKLQSWFKSGKERYWVVDESQGAREPVSQASRVQARDVVDIGEELEDGPGEMSGGNTSDQSDVDDQIERSINEWKVSAREHRLRVIANPPTVELDPWLRYTQWHQVLSQSKHDMIKTYRYLREPDPEEVELQRVLRAWNRIFERGLNTLAAIDHKDVLKWWGSPKNEVASQRPFELPQNKQTTAKYSKMWQQFICYSMRTAPADFDEETETGVTFSQDQWRPIDEMRTQLMSNPPEDEFVDDSEQDQALTNQLMRFCMSVVLQDTSKITLYKSPLMHYLAIRGIDEHAKSLRSSFWYTPILAGALWVCRLIILEIAVPAEPWPECGLQSKQEIESIPRRVRQMRRKHICEGSYSPTSSILTQLAMGKKLNTQHNSPANIDWSDDKQTIFFNGMPVELVKISRMCEEITAELHGLMTVLGFGKGFHTIDLSQVIDSMAWSSGFRETAFDFTSHVRNREELGKGHSYLLKRARKAQGEHQIITSVNGEDQWIKSRVQAYLQQERKFLRKLMVIFHVTAGQPARGPEIGSVKVSNSPQSARNIYIMHGRVLILTTYDKAQKRRQNTEYIIRCLPTEVGQILVQYIVFVRPFARALDYRVLEYLFADVGGPWAGEQLTRESTKVTEKHLGVRLTVSDWRHVAIGIAVQHLGPIGKAWEGDEEDEDGEFARGEDEEELGVNAIQHIVVRQASHGQPIAQQYAIDGAFLHRLGPQLIASFEQASIAWHRLFKFGMPERAKRSAEHQLTPASVKRERIKDEGIVKREPTNKASEDHKAIIVSKAIQGLQRIYPNGKPQSEGQATALELVHDPPKTLIIVLPTSSGKSVLFFSVAAMTQQQTVIVVVPFAALVDDIIARGRVGGLSCEEWFDERSGRELRQLIVVSADRAVSPEFIFYAHQLERNEQLAHVFFDECHVAFTDTSYRERLRELWKLRYLDCPFTCLTATLMIELEETLRDRLLIPDAVLLRRSTARKGIRYQVRDSQEEPPSSVAVQMIQELGPLPDRKRGVVYVRSYTTGRVISEALGCAFYMARADKKGEVLQAWAEGAGGWMVATGALGTGINIEGITHVIHVDRPYGLTSFAQQSGRGGRGGEISRSIIVVRVHRTESRRHRAIQSEYSVEQIDEQAMTEFIQSTGCRRGVLSRYFDDVGPPLSCRQSDMVYCDFCERQAKQERRQARGARESRVEGEVVDRTRDEREGQEPRGSAVIAQRMRVLAESEEEMIGVMEELKRACVYCQFVHGGMDRQPVHTFDRCSNGEVNGCGIGAYHQWRRGIDLGQGGHCYRCGLSQDICRTMEEGGECEFIDIMLPGIFVLYTMRAFQGVVESIGFQGSYPEDVWEWLICEDDMIDGSRESNWMRAWRGICHTYSSMRREGIFP